MLSYRDNSVPLGNDSSEEKVEYFRPQSSVPEIRDLSAAKRMLEERNRMYNELGIKRIKL